MDVLNLFVNESGMQEFERVRQQKKDLIAQMPNRKLRNTLLKNIDLSIDKLAEIFVAMAKDWLVVDGHGHDFTTRSGRIKIENKFATLAHYTKNTGYTSHVTSVSNLLSKNCDLVILVDMGGWLKYFEIPVDVWKSKWKSNKADLCFGRDYHKSWYSRYEVPREKFFSGNSIWTTF